MKKCGIIDSAEEISEASIMHDRLQTYTGGREIN